MHCTYVMPICDNLLNWLFITQQICFDALSLHLMHFSFAVCEWMVCTFLREPALLHSWHPNMFQFGLVYIMLSTLRTWSFHIPWWFQNSLAYHFFPGQRVNRTECHKNKKIILNTTEGKLYEQAFFSICRISELNAFKNHTAQMQQWW